jgi:ATP-dependent Zn protease
MACRQKDWLLRTAYHESGHAVVGRVLTLACGQATIMPDDDSGGHSICADPLTCEYEWERRGKVRADNAAYYG